MNFSPGKLLLSRRHPLLRLLAIVSCLLLVGMFGLFRLGDWLTPCDVLPDRIDLIVTFAGDSRRVDYSRELMERYPDAHWFLSDYRNGYGRLLRKDGYDMRRVTIVDTCTNTLSEVRAVAGWIADGVPVPPATDDTGKSRTLVVGLVSSPYHMRRIDLMAHRYLGDRHIGYVLLPVPFGNYRWEKKTFRYWWRNKFITSLTITELVKIGYFLLTGYL